MQNLLQLISVTILYKSQTDHPGAEKPGMVRHSLFFFLFLACTNNGETWAKHVSSGACYECSCQSSSVDCNLIWCAKCDGIAEAVPGSCCPKCTPSEYRLSDINNNETEFTRSKRSGNNAVNYHRFRKGNDICLYLTELGKPNTNFKLCSYSFILTLSDFI